MPRWREYRVTVAGHAGVGGRWPTASTSLLGVNYGYLNRKPASASLLDLLGPWPVYLLRRDSASCSPVWALLTWPWVLADVGGTAVRLGAG